MLRVLPIRDTTVDHHQVEWELQDPTCQALSTVALDGNRLVGARITIDMAAIHTRPWVSPVPMGDWAEFAPMCEALEAKGIRHLGVTNLEERGVVVDLLCAGVDREYASRGLYHAMTVASLDAAGKMGFSHAVVLTVSGFTAKTCGGRLGFRPAASMAVDDWRRSDGTSYVVVEPPHNEMIVWVRELERKQ
ncbi:hypothetical protein Pelo_2071 [Pelomyxa schiedti]|nr:hypothetical protein Pelo_2071 [Pelomyxa schiedti]